VKTLVAVALSLGAVMLGGPTQAQDVGRLSEVAQAYAKTGKFMGSVLVAQGDRILLDKGYGWANLDWRIPDAPDVKYRIGSVTKQFTAALVLLLQQDGKLNIEDPVSKYLPDLPAAWSKVTISQLLHQTAGIPNFTSSPAFIAWAAAPHGPKDFLSLVKDKPLQFEPGSRFSYSNSNYELLGAVIEAVTGKSYEEVLRARLIEPLGLSSTGLDADDLVLPRRASGYTDGPKGLAYARSESMSVPWAAGAIYSTTHDLLAWEQGLYRGRVLSGRSLAAMTAPGLGEYGMGLFIEQHAGEPLFQHDGGVEGFASFLSWLPSRRIAVVVLSNDESDAVPVMASQLLDVALGRPVVLPDQRKDLPLATAQLARVQGAFQVENGPRLQFGEKGGKLSMDVDGKARPLFYEGERGGHMMFWDPTTFVEVEFMPDPTGSVSSAVLYVSGRAVPARRV
jgi:CubicO group peptidase (beta-lactamase class C family)